jgi:hypothetical protein
MDKKDDVCSRCANLSGYDFCEAFGKKIGRGLDQECLRFVEEVNEDEL